MPRRFAFNDTNGVGDVYLPGSLMRRIVNAPSSIYIPWIKLRPNITLAAANAALEPTVRQFAKQHPERFPDHWHLALQPIIVPYEQETGGTLTLLLAGVVLLLIIGCANCSILLLARGRARQHELALRSAIGASRWRIVRQLLVEAVVFSSTGAVLGVAASYWLAKLPPVAFSGFLSSRICHPHQRSYPRVLRRACAALGHPLRSCPRIASLASRIRAYAPRQADWRCRWSSKASLERSHHRASRAHASSHGHCWHRHSQLS